MVKLWLIIGLTVFVGIVTAILGLMNEARFVVILGRMLGAMLFVGILTYLLIFFFQTTYLKVIKNFIEANDTPKTDKTITQFKGKPEVPSSLKKTHSELLQQLHQFTLINDSSATVALKLEELMLHHFLEEEDYILSPLGLLPSLSKGQFPEHPQEIIILSEKAKSQIDHMSAEHQLITAYIEELKQASAEENQPAIIAFEKDVSKHALSEEEVYFPAAIMVGEYLKSKLKSN